MRIFILGGYGLTGKLLARHLLAQTAADIIIAGRNPDKAAAFAGQLNTEFAGQRATARRADAADGPGLCRALAGSDFLLVAAPTTQHAEPVIRAALDAGVDYLDIQLDANKVALLKKAAPEIERTGRCFITEAGYHPGLPAAMVRFAAARLDRLDAAVVAGYLNMGRDLPYSDAVDELMEVFRLYEAQTYRDGRWTEPNQYVTREVDFGGEIGPRKCFSMFFEELRDLPVMYPTLRELGFYMASTHWVIDWVLTPLVMAGLKIPSPGLSHNLGRLMWWGMQTFSRPPYVVMIHTAARGEKDGAPAVVEVAVAHADGYELTAIPVVACLTQYLDGTARRPGLWVMGHLVEPERFFVDMARMGARVTWQVNDESQDYLWPADGHAGESEAQADIDAGRVKTFESIKDLTVDLAAINEVNL